MRDTVKVGDPLYLFGDTVKLVAIDEQDPRGLVLRVERLPRVLDAEPDPVSGERPAAATLDAQGPTLSGGIGRHDFLESPLRSRPLDPATWAGAATMLQEQQGIFRFCCEEVQRQGDNAMAVWHLYEAWSLARTLDAKGPLTLRTLATWGNRVSPGSNPNGFRALDVHVGATMPPHWREVPHKLATLLAGIAAIGSRRGPQWEFLPGQDSRVVLNLDEIDRLTPWALAYYNFERIHPFRDGNGRTGKILYNWLCGTLHRPEMPPNFWGCSNP